MCTDPETYECSVQFYHYESLNFVYSAGFTFLLSSSWHRLNLIWSRVSLSLTPPLSALTTQEQKRAFVRSYLHFLPPHLSQFTADICPLQLSSFTALGRDTSIREGLKNCIGESQLRPSAPSVGRGRDLRPDRSVMGPGAVVPAALPRGGRDTPRGAGGSSSSSICFAACLLPRPHVFNT